MPKASGAKGRRFESCRARHKNQGLATKNCESFSFAKKIPTLFPTFLVKINARQCTNIYAILYLGLDMHCHKLEIFSVLRSPNSFYVCATCLAPRVQHWSDRSLKNGLTNAVPVFAIFPLLAQANLFGRFKCKNQDRVIP